MVVKEKSIWRPYATWTKYRSFCPSCKEALTQYESSFAILELIFEFLQETTQYPILGPKAKKHGNALKSNKFRKNFQQFIFKWTRKILPYAFNPLEDEDDEDDPLNNPLNYFKLWIGPMSGSPSRAFRHTATVVALWITTVLCEKIHLLNADHAKLQKQLESSAKKTKSASDKKIAVMKQDLKDIQGKKSILEEYMNEFFNG